MIVSQQATMPVANGTVILNDRLVRIHRRPGTVGAHARCVRLAVAGGLLAALLPLACAEVPAGTGDPSNAAGDAGSGDAADAGERGDAGNPGDPGETGGTAAAADPGDSGSGRLLAADHPAWDTEMARAMCFGNGVERHSTDAEQARRLMAGKIQLGSHPVTDLPDQPTWTENPFRDDNWEAAYHKLTWLDVLRREGNRTGDERMLRRWQTLLADWVRHHPHGFSGADQAARPRQPGQSQQPGQAVSDWVWREVPTAQRTLVLTCAVAELGPLDWLRSAIRQHGEALSDPELRVELGNHAMLQNNGLLAAGCVAGEEDWARLAYDANDRLLGRAVDEQGVTDEGSVDYQNNNYRWWLRTADRLEPCGLPDWRHLDRLARMPELMAHATAPDGTYAMLGDTQLGKAKPVPGTVAEYAATQGESGPMPRDLIRVFDRGYVFGRSGWGVERPFDQESFFTLRFGLPRSEQVHGHADHGSITFASHGNTLLYDQGLYAFNGGSMRSHVRSPAGHNSVTVSGAAYDLDASAELVARQQTSTHALFTVRVTAADATVWTRTLFYSRYGRYLLVDDRVLLPAPTGQGPTEQGPAGQGPTGQRDTEQEPAQRTAVQRFHLGSDRKVHVGENHVHTSGEGTDVGLFWLVNEPALDVARGGRDPLEGWRSMAYRQAEPAPVARAALTSTRPRFSTVVAPLPGARGPESVRIENVVLRSDSLDATVRIGDHVEWVQIRPDGATVTPPSWLYDVTDDGTRKRPAGR